MTLTADHHDAGKPAVELLPPRATLFVGQVMGFGEDKYPRKIPDEPNYLHGVGVPPRKLLGSVLRHCFRYLAGEWLDQESGLPHLAHAAADAMMALEVEMKRGAGMKVYTIPVIGCFYVEAHTKEEAEAEVRTAAKNAGVELVRVLPSYAEGLGGEDEDTLHR